MLQNANRVDLENQAFTSSVHDDNIEYDGKKHTKHKSNKETQHKLFGFKCVLHLPSLHRKVTGGHPVGCPLPTKHLLYKSPAIFEEHKAVN